MVEFIQGVLWRIYQMALMLTGMILSSVSGVFNDGWQHVFGIFIAGFFLSYFGTRITVSIIDRLKRDRPGTRRVER